MGKKATLTFSYGAGEAGGYTYKSSNPDVCTITKVTATKYTLQGQSKGTAEITIGSYNGLSKKCSVTVLTPAVSGADPSNEQLSVGSTGTVLGVGEMAQMLVKSDLYGIGKGTYVTSNANVASVEKSSGIITATGAGSCKITFTSVRGASISKNVTVYAAPTFITLNKTTFSGGVGETVKLKATVDESAHDEITYSSSNKAVATVSASGKVTLVGTGSCYITAATYNGLTAKCNITSQSAPSKMTISKTNASMYTSGSLTLSVAYLTGEAGAWSCTSSNTDVAVCEKTSSVSLLVTPVNPGQTIITCTSYNGLSVRCTVTVMNSTKYRAIIVANSYSGTSSYLHGPAKDMANFTGMLASMTATPFQITQVPNAGARTIMDTILSFEGKTNSADVTVFYFSGHGGSMGSIVGNDRIYITPSQLRVALDRIAGRKIVVLDSCYSGKFIGKNLKKSLNGKSLSTQLDAANSAFMQGFITGNSPERDEDFGDDGEYTPLPGFEGRSDSDLASSGYYVITACKGSEYSADTYYGGRFTYMLNYSCGWNSIDQCQMSLMEADANSDQYITLKELYDYLEEEYNDLVYYSGGYYDPVSVCAYPMNSSQRLWGRK